MLRSLFFFLFGTLHAHLYEVAIMGVFRDEAPYLKEWIEYHLLVGVDHFYLANHFSTDNYLEVLEPYIRTGVVDLFDLKEDFNKNDPYKWYKWNSIQSRLYNNILFKRKDETKWLVALDIDEYLVPYEDNNLNDFLKDYEDYGGVSIFWKNFGTSFVEKIPDNSLMIEVLTLRADDDYDWNRYFKTIVRPERVLYYPQPHWPLFKKDYYSVAANFQPIVKSPETFICHDRIAIHHFWTKDEDFFSRVKLGRRSDWNQLEEIFDRKEKCNSIEDYYISKYIYPLKEIMLIEKYLFEDPYVVFIEQLKRSSK